MQERDGGDGEGGGVAGLDGHLGGGAGVAVGVGAVRAVLGGGGALAAGVGTRLVLAARFRQPVVSALVHPAGVAALLAVQWYSLVRAARGGRATWRGRAYPAQ